jgi:hypothetical protein
MTPELGKVIPGNHKLADYLYDGGVTGGGIARLRVRRRKPKPSSKKTVTEFKGFKPRHTEI